MELNIKEAYGDPLYSGAMFGHGDPSDRMTDYNSKDYKTKQRNTLRTVYDNALFHERERAELFGNLRELTQSLEEGDHEGKGLQLKVETSTLPGPQTRDDYYGIVHVTYERRVTVSELKDGKPTEIGVLVFNVRHASELSVDITSDTFNGKRINEEELPAIMSLLERAKETQTNSPVSAQIDSSRSNTRDTLK